MPFGEYIQHLGVLLIAMDHEGRGEGLEVVAYKMGDSEVFAALVLGQPGLEGHLGEGGHSVHLGLLELLGDEAFAVAVEQVVLAL